MKKLSISEADIVIEWRCTCPGGATNSSARDVRREDVLNLARALGRLAAQRDLAKSAAHGAGRVPEFCQEARYNGGTEVDVSGSDVAE